MTTQVKWFIGKDSQGVFAVYKAVFDGKLIMSEKQWYLGGNGWKPTNQVSEWHFVGNDTVYESTQSEAEKYLPSIAKVA